MKSFFDKLNLRPGERRLVVIVGIVIFVVLNLWFIWPNFGKLAVLQQKIKDTKINLSRFSTEVKRKSFYLNQLKDLENQGIFVGQEDQALQLSREVTSQSQLAGVTVLRADPTPRLSGPHTNAFFDESSVVITVTTGEKELIDFLYNLGNRNSLIRVRSMTLGPEPNRMKLQGTLTVAESFQKKPPTKAALAATPAAKSATPASKPASAKPPDKKTPPPPKSPVTNTKTNQVKKPIAPK